MRDAVCGHGKSLQEHCVVCEKLDRISERIAELREALAGSASLLSQYVDGVQPSPRDAWLARECVADARALLSDAAPAATLESTFGRWPGEETDEELREAMKENDHDED